MSLTHRYLLTPSSQATTGRFFSAPTQSGVTGAHWTTLTNPNGAPRAGPGAHWLGSAALIRARPNIHCNTDVPTLSEIRFSHVTCLPSATPADGTWTCAVLGVFSMFFVFRARRLSAFLTAELRIAVSGTPFLSPYLSAYDVKILVPGQWSPKLKSPSQQVF